MKLIDAENIDFVILEDSLHRIEHKKGDEVNCVIGANEVKAVPIEKLEHIKNRIIESSIVDDDEKYVDNGNLIIETRTVLQIIDNAIKEQNE